MLSVGGLGFGKGGKSSPAPFQFGATFQCIPGARKFRKQGFSCALLANTPTSAWDFCNNAALSGHFEMLQVDRTICPDLPILGVPA